MSELVDLIEKVDADGYGLDLRASAFLSALIPKEVAPDGPKLYRLCISEIVQVREPTWIPTMLRGRKRFIQNLAPDAQAVFEAAGLLVDHPDQNLVAWWDKISGLARQASNLAKLAQGRAAELLTLDREKTRLQDQGIDKEPEWLGLDDNFAGYDVLTYDRGHSGLINRLIEVKSTIASPPRFVLSRNEWRQATKSSDSYSFHIWEMQREPPRLHVLTVNDVAPHIPKDRGLGNWREVEVRVPAHE